MLKLIGEFLSFISAFIEIYERGSQTYKKTLEVGFIRYIIQTLAYVLLGGVNGTIISMMAIIRQMFLYKKKFTDKVVAGWIIVSAVINIYFANTLTDLFPFIATIQFTLMAKKQNTVSLKYAGIINTLIWSVYHIAHKNYVYLLFGLILTVTTVIRIKKGVQD